MAASLVSRGVFMKFSREAEREADQIGARMLYDARVKPQSMISFFDKLASLQTSQPNAVVKFFSSHPSPTERSENLSSLIAGMEGSADLLDDAIEFHEIKQRLASLPRPEVEAAKALAAIAAAAQPPSEPTPEVRKPNLERDREIAAQFAPIFHQALGPAPRYDYITNFDFDGDWRGDNNWNNSANARFPLKAHVYYSVFETRTHYFIHYAAFHPRDYKGGEQRGATMSQLMRLGVSIGGQYDPTGRAAEAVMAHENDLEGALVVAEKSGRLTLVETLAHNAYLRYVPPGSAMAGDPVLLDGVRPHLFIEPKGHGIEAWRDDALQRKQAEKGFIAYVFTGTAEDPDAATGKQAIGYDLVPTLDTFWIRAQNGKNETHGEQHDYGVVTVRLATDADKDADKGEVRHLKLGIRGSALNGVVGAANMSRPPWGWFDGQDRARPLGEWFLQPAETIRRRWNLPESFSTTYTYHPFFGRFR
jgi:hypothetical protein